MDSLAPESVTKICTRCGEDKLLEDFHKASASPDGRKWECKSCACGRELQMDSTATLMAWKEANPDYNKTYYERNRVAIRKKQKEAHLRRQYDLTQAEVDQMVSDQDGRCLICNEKKRLVVDHSHDTGVVRGLLCHGCNTKLAAIENAGFMESAVAYLEMYQ